MFCNPEQKLQDMNVTDFQHSIPNAKTWCSNKILYCIYSNFIQVVYPTELDNFCRKKVLNTKTRQLDSWQSDVVSGWSCSYKNGALLAKYQPGVLNPFVLTCGCLLYPFKRPSPPTPENLLHCNYILNKVHKQTWRWLVADKYLSSDTGESIFLKSKKHVWYLLQFPEVNRKYSANTKLNLIGQSLVWYTPIIMTFGSSRHWNFTLWKK